MGNKAPHIEQSFTWLGSVLVIWFWLVFLTPSTPATSITDRQSYFSCLMPWQGTHEPDYAPTDFWQKPLTLTTLFSGFLTTSPVDFLPGSGCRFLSVLRTKKPDDQRPASVIASVQPLLFEHQIAINAP